MSEQTNDIRGLAQDLVAHGATAREPVTLPDGSMGIVLPDRYTLHKVPPALPKLTVVSAKPVFHDLHSFIEYVNTFKIEGKTRVFAEPGFLSPANSAHIHAIIDYHGPSGGSVEADLGGNSRPSPDHGRHIVSFVPPYSDEWKIWVIESPEGLLQTEFAEFIEENRSDIRFPEAAPLIDLIKAFKASRKVDFNSVVNQTDGSIRIGYSDEAQGGAGYDVPPALRIGIPVYFNGPLYEVNVFMRYRVAPAKVTFTLKPDRADYVENAAFGETLKTFAEATSLTPYIGRA